MAQRWFTCTPVEFGGGPDFFARDSGLTCRGLREAGCESMAVMPGTSRPDDEGDLIRTAFSNLESAEWWRGHRLDGVVLYAWGSPRYRKVARAIKEAGIFLVLNQDSSGLISPLARFSGWLSEQKTMSTGWPSLAKLILRGVAGIVVTDPARAAHLREGDIIACVSPAAAENYCDLCRFYGGVELANRVEVVPHPVESRFHFDQSHGEKARLITCVGRWEDHLQKRPHLMQEVLHRLADEDHEVRVEIAGRITPELDAWHRSLSPNVAERVKLRGILSREALAELFGRSRIFYSSSAYESFGIAAGEALCSGCSVVAADSPSLASFPWFISESSGRLVSVDDVGGHVETLKTELSSWDNRERHPLVISRTWASRLHAGQVARRILELRGRPISR